MKNISKIQKEIQIADFGMATLVAGPLVEMCSTPTYVAPEVLSRSGYTYQVDIWGLGVITYILLSGHPPFRSASQEQSYQEKVQKNIDTIQWVRPMSNSGQWATVRPMGNTFTQIRFF